jgi:hypothetical protein
MKRMRGYNPAIAKGDLEAMAAAAAAIASIGPRTRGAQKAPRTSRYRSVSLGVPAFCFPSFLFSCDRDCFLLCEAVVMFFQLFHLCRPFRNDALVFMMLQAFF